MSGPVEDTPFLVAPATGTRYSLAGRDRLTVGRSRDTDVVLRDPRCSRKQFEVVREPDGWVLHPLSAENPPRVNGEPAHGPVRLADGCRVEVGNTVLIFRTRPNPITLVGGPERTLLAGSAEVSVDDAIRIGETVPVTGDLLIGRDPAAEVVLPHPLVSRRHATITVRDGLVTLTDLVSANGTFVNGRPILAPVQLRPGDRIDIGPYTLRFSGTALEPSTRAGNVELRAWRLTRVVHNEQTGQPLTILDDVSLVVQPGQFVCLLGPSGSGKSTLLAALSGRVPPDRGRVLINGTDLYAAFGTLKRDIAVVPQRDLLFETLTVDQALTYTARLRLPPDTAPLDLRRQVDELIRTVGLDERRDTPIRMLSGGQLKRVSLANELIGRPSLIFVDEVTSGLDEQTDREIMALFRRLADSGKTVVCVTHTLANVERTCHAVVVLTPGGKLAFVGSPAGARTHFGVERLGDVYERLRERKPEEWQAAFEASPEYVSAAHETPPELPAPEPGTGVAGAGPAAGVVEAARQGWILARRRAVLLRQDRPTLLTLALQTGVVAATLILVFGDLGAATDLFARARDTVTLYFLLAVSCFWFGCNCAVKVLVGDRPIYRRERAVNLSLFGYAGSTFLVYCSLAVTQAVVLAAVVRIGCDPPGMGTGVLAVLAATAAAGTAIGLLLSAAARTEEVAVASVPLVLIPQIVLGGAIAALSGAALLLAKALVTCYWAQKALTRLLPEDVATLAGIERLDAVAAAAVVVGHLVVFASAAILLVVWQDRWSRRASR